jgi:hypothetical protein
MQGVRGEQDPAQSAEYGFDCVEQRSESGDLVALGVDRDLGQDDAGAGIQGGQQVNLTAVDAGATQGFAVDGDHHAIPPRRWHSRDAGP